MASLSSPLRASLGASTSAARAPRFAAAAAAPARGHRRAASAASRLAAVTHKVEVLHEGRTIVLNVPEGETILSVALDVGVHLPHDCKLGVCMTCPARLVRAPRPLPSLHPSSPPFLPITHTSFP